MTDSEIVKALDEAELFLRNRVMDGKPLKLNEYDIGILRNISQVCAKAYDEINRLQAENINLKGHLEQLKSRYDNAKAEIERLKNTLDDALDRQPLLVERSEKYAKAEAYKEFAERLKEKLAKNKYILPSVFFSIDNLLKKLVGDK